MNKLKEKYIDNISNIVLTDERNDYLKLETINRYKKRKKKNKIVFSLIMIFSILIIGTGITYANDIKASISEVITKISNRTTSNGSTYTNFKLESKARKKLNYDAVLRESTCQNYIGSCDTIDVIDECYSIYTYEELERALGIEILKNDLFKDNRIVVTKISRKDEKISYLRFSMLNPMDAEKNSGKTTKIYMEIIMRTKYNTSNNDTIWEANLSSEKNIKEYYIKSINDKAYIFYTFSHTQSVFIIHDDILYRLKISIGDDYSSNPDKAVQKILEAFHY